jgi:integrase
MGCSYLVLRKARYHFRMTFPADVRGYIGKREIHVSLREDESRKARLKAGLFAFEVRRLIELVRHAVKTLSEVEVRALVAGWRQHMVEMDSAIRRRIEAGLEPFGLDRYEVNCAGTADMLGSLADSIAPAMPDRPSASPRERERAFAHAAECATDAPSDDFVPLMAAEEFAALDVPSQRTLILSWLPAAAAIFDRKAAACHQVGDRLIDATAVPPPVVNALSLTERERTPLGQAWQEYLRHMAGTHPAWREKPAGKTALAGLNFLGLTGHDKPIGNISRDDFDRYEWFINHRPPRSNGQGAEEDLLALERNLRTAGTLSENRLGRRTVEEYLQRIVKFFDWAKTKGFVREHYAEGMSYKLGSESQEDRPRLPWTDEEVKAMLDPVALGNFIRARTKARYPDRWSYLPWFLLLVCYTGARRNEIAGLMVDDIIVRNEQGTGVPVLMIQKNEVRPSLKNISAQRGVPIHQDLIDLGLIDLVEHRRSRGHRRVLWNRVSGKDVGTKVSNDFTEYVKAIGVFDPAGLKVLHSFRHTFKTKAGGYIKDDVIQTLVGHAKRDSTNGSYVHYLNTPRREHRPMVNKLCFDLDLPGLKLLLRECVGS